MSQTLEEMVAKSFSRYLRVLPQGFEIYPDHIEEEITVKLLTFSSARTLYHRKKPICRSLNAINSLDNKLECASCKNRIRCTPQIYLELENEKITSRLILSYTSARNFMQFIGILKRKRLSIFDINFQMRVLDRGRWGEIRFFLA